MTEDCYKARNVKYENLVFSLVFSFVNATAVYICISIYVYIVYIYNVSYSALSRVRLLNY